MSGIRLILLIGRRSAARPRHRARTGLRTRYHSKPMPAVTLRRAIKETMNKYLDEKKWPLERLVSERVRIEAKYRKQSTPGDIWLVTREGRKILDDIAWGITERIKESKSKQVDLL